MKKFNPILFFICLLLFISPAQAQSQVDMETYYTSPEGSYLYTRLVPRAVALGNPCDPGSFYVDNSSGTSIIRYCNDAGGGVGQWGLIPGIWIQNDATDSIYTQDAGARVGIGLQNPSEKLQINASAAVPARILIEGDSDNAGAGEQVGLRLYSTAAPGLPSDLYASNADGDLNLIHETNPFGSKKIFLRAGQDGGPNGKDFVLDNSTDLIGLWESSPGAFLDIVNDNSATQPLFFISTSEANNGDVFYIDRDLSNTRVGISQQNPQSPLHLTAATDLSFLNGDDDIRSDGGGDNRLQFIHQGANTGRLDFISSAGNNMASIYNNQSLTAGNKMSVGRNSVALNANVDFQLHGKIGAGADDVFVLFSDNGVVNHVSPPPPSCPYIIDETIGIITTLRTDDGGAGGNSLTGITPGDGSTPGYNEPAPALTLVGAIGRSNPSTQMPAVHMFGLTQGLGRRSDFSPTLQVSDRTSDHAGRFVIQANGFTGIGMNLALHPLNTLHIRDTMKLEPMDSPPGICNSSREGMLYADGDGNALCYCNSSLWFAVGGSGACN